MKLVLALAPFTAIVIFALIVAIDLAGVPIGRASREALFPIAMLAYLILGAAFAAGIAILQIGALGLLRLLGWQGPVLEIESGKHLGRVFE